MRFSRLVEVSLLIVCGLAGLFVIELAVRVFRPQIFERHPAGMYTADPDVGYVLTPNFRGTLQRSEFEIQVETGELGLRCGDPRPRQPNTFRVLLLGDSQVWGYGVECGETVARRLEALLQVRYPHLDIQVLNGGVPGYGTADALNLLRSRGERIDAELVVLVFLPVNDFDENRNPAANWARVENGYLVWESEQDSSALSDRFSRLHRWLKMNSHAARLLSDTLGYMALRGGFLPWMGSLWQTGESFSDQDSELAARLLRQIAEAARDLGAASLFVYTTGQDRVLAESYVPPKSALVVAKAAEAAGVAWEDVTPDLRARSDRLELFYPRDGHWTASGHLAVAEILSRKIASMSLVPER